MEIWRSLLKGHFEQGPKGQAAGRNSQAKGQMGRIPYLRVLCAFEWGAASACGAPFFFAVGDVWLENPSEEIFEKKERFEWN